MPTGPYYVYALIDPRELPPRPFYIGKGTGSRAYAHLMEENRGRKNKRIQEIETGGHEVVVRQLVTELSETDALRIEAQLIAAHGTVDTGGILLNKVVPTGKMTSKCKNIVVPVGSLEKSQLGLSLVKESVLELAAANPAGITNANAASSLGLQSDHAGKHPNFLSWSVLGILMREGRIKKVKGKSSRDTHYEYVKVGNTGSA